MPKKVHMSLVYKVHKVIFFEYEMFN